MKELTTKVIIKNVRLSYLHAFEPKGINGDDPKYSASLIIPKTATATIQEIRAAIEAAAQAGTAKFGGKVPPNLKLPLRDGDIDREDDEAYKNSFFINANSNTAPGLIYKNGLPITDPTDLYSGCYAHVSVTFYAFNSNGNKGVACGLNHIMKTGDGEPLGGSGKATDVFADLIEEDDFLN